MIPEYDDSIIEEALVDSYGDIEQIASFCAYLQDTVQLPMTAHFLGRHVQIIELDNDNSRVLAVVQDGNKHSRLDLRELSVVGDSEAARAVGAYLTWRGGW